MRAYLTPATGKIDVECGGLPPLSRREIAPGMAGKKRLPRFAEVIDRPSQASLLNQSGGKPPHSTSLWGENLQPA
jgi:hypothetical protein